MWTQTPKSCSEPQIQPCCRYRLVWVMGMAAPSFPLFRLIHTARMRRRDYGAYNSCRADSTRSRN